MMKLIIISGLSGSGKTVALHTLEDENYYCIDNLPLALLTQLVASIAKQKIKFHDAIAVGIDARSHVDDLSQFNQIIDKLKKQNIAVEVIYVKAEMETLIKRFSDTRRKHPLTKKGLPLFEAIEVERNLLKPIADSANLYIDTTHTNIHQLRNLIKARIVKRQDTSLSLLFQSFGFKNGAPTDSDFVFDVRCLPNPHWEKNLQHLTGLDKNVIQFLKAQEEVEKMLQQIQGYLDFCTPQFIAQNRYYLTISIGCTGGQHRSVYIAQALHDYFSQKMSHVSLRHRELDP